MTCVSSGFPDIFLRLLTVTQTGMSGSLTFGYLLRISNKPLLAVYSLSNIKRGKKSILVHYVCLLRYHCLCTGDMQQCNYAES